MKQTLRKMAWAAGWWWMAALALAPLAGCGDDGDDGDDETATTVETVSGTDAATGSETDATTNSEADASTDSQPAADAATNAVVDAVEAAVLAVAGEWNGVFNGDEGSSHLDLELRQDGDAVTGQFALSRGGSTQTGNASGSVDGNRLTVGLTVLGSEAWIDLDGQVNAAGTEYVGTWTGTFGDGDFALQR